MKRTIILGVLTSVVVISGCDKAAPPTAATDTATLTPPTAPAVSPEAAAAAITADNADDKAAALEVEIDADVE
jgi:hypothetical protein